MYALSSEQSEIENIQAIRCQDASFDLRLSNKTTKVTHRMTKAVSLASILMVVLSSNLAQARSLYEQS